MTITRPGCTFGAVLALLFFVAPPVHADDIVGWKALHARYTGFTFGDGKIRTLQASDSVTVDGKAKDEIRWRRIGILSRLDTESITAHTSWSNGFTGNVFWYSDENGFTVPVVEGGAKEQLAETLVFTDAITALPWTLARNENLDGTPYLVFRVEPPKGYPIELYLEPKTGAYGRVTIDPKGAAEYSFRVLDYAEAAPGLKVISRWRGYGDGPTVASTLHDIVVNGALSPDDLHPPAASASWTFGADTIPIQLTRDRVIVHARVNGVPGTFMLDTGAANIYLSGAFARRAGIKSMGHLDVAGITHVDRNDSGRADTFAFGDSVLHNVVLYFGSAEFDDKAPDGLIGFDLFAGSVVTVDFVASTMRVEDAANPSAPEPGYAAQADLSSGQPVISMLLDKSLELHVLFDTGSPRWMLIPADLTSRYGLHMVGNGLDDDTCGTLDDLTLGPLVYPSPFACGGYGATGRDALVGLDFMRLFAKIRFDYSRGLVEFVPRPKA